MVYNLVHVGDQKEWENLDAPVESVTLPLIPEYGVIYNGWVPALKLSKKIKNWIKRLNGVKQTCYYCCAAQTVQEGDEYDKNRLEYKLVFRFTDVRHAVLFRLTFN